MIDFAPGMRTIIRDEEWMVKKIETNSLGNKTLYCVGISPLVKDREAIFLMDLEEIQIVDPAEVKLVADTSPFYKRALLYLESQWRQQIPTDANLHIGHKAAMDLMPYQLDPAKLALQRPRQRILIADTVGLGKTLEAGILMSELIARGKGKRILVVTVKSMMTQFQKEMWKPLFFGIFAGYYVVQIICAIFVYGVNSLLPNVMGVMKYIGAAYILWLAIHIAFSKKTSENTEQSASFLKGFMLQFVNVKIYMFGVTALMGYVVGYMSSFPALLFFELVIATIGTIATCT